MVLVCLVAAGACGKRGDPLPPLSVTPQGITGLKLAQRGTALEVSYVAPRATAGGVRLGVLDVEILRADTPGDFQKQAKRTRHRAAPGESLTDTSPLPPVGTTVRVAARAIERGHVSGSTPVVALVVQSPPPGPHGLVAELKGDVVALRWEGTIPSPPPSPSPSPAASPRPGTSPSPAALPGVAPVGVAPYTGVTPAPPPGSASPRPGTPVASPTPRPVSRGFLVYRRSDPAGSYGAPLRTPPDTVNAVEDRTVAIGQQWCYVVATVVSTEPVVESARSNEACLSVRDIVPPASPVGVAALGGPDGVEVSWSPSAEADLASYRVYRQAPGGPREPVGEVAPPETSLRDATAARGVPYAYTVTAVDRAGNESPPSAAAPGSRP